MLESITSFFSSKVTLVMVGIIIALGGYSYYASSKNTSLTLQVEQKDKAIESIIEGYNATLEIERAIATEKAITMEQKQEVIKTTSKVKEAVIKRGEIKQDEKSNFTIVNF